MEKQVVTTNVERALNQLNQEYSKLQAIAYGWTDWDDTYNFMYDTNQDFIDANLNYNSFSYINVNFMLFYNNSGDLIYSKAFNLTKGNEINLSSSFYAFIDENKKTILNNHNSTTYYSSGIILSDENEAPFIVTASSIVHSSGEGPVQGTLVMGRYLNEDIIKFIENITRLTIYIQPLSIQRSTDFNKISSYVYGKTISVRSTNSTYIAGYVVINDIVSHPAFILEVGSNRDVYNQGLGLIQNFNIFLLIIMAVFTFIIIFILDRFVISRLATLTKTINDIKSSRDLSRQFHTKGNDEIATLERKIDTMFTSLHKAWTMKDVAESSLKKKIDELERFKLVTIDREMKMIELKKQLAEYKGQVGEKR